MRDLVGRYAYPVLMVSIVGGLYLYADIQRRNGAIIRDLMHPVPGFTAAAERSAREREQAELDLIPLGKATARPFPTSQPVASAGE